MAERFVAGSKEHNHGQDGAEICEQTAYDAQAKESRIEDAKEAEGAMTDEQIVLSEIQEAITKLPVVSREAVEEMAEHFRRVIKQASAGEGELALALVGAELATK